MSESSAEILIRALADDDPEGRRNAARKLGELGLGGAEAIPSLAKLLEDPEAAVQIEASQALRAIHGGNVFRKGADKEEIDSEIRACSEALALDPDNAALFARRAILRAAQDNYLEAIIDATEALKRDPDHVPSLLVRGEARAKNRGSADGVEDCSRAVMLSPTNPCAYLSRGRARATNRKLEDAIADFTRAIELDPRSAAAYEGRAEALEAFGRKDLALEDCERALASAPADGPLRKQVSSRIEAYRAEQSKPAQIRVTPCFQCRKELTIPSIGRYRCESCNLIYHGPRDKSPRSIAVRGSRKSRVPDVGFEAFEVDWPFATDDLKRMRWGFVPCDMDEKWAIFAEGNEVCFLRSWTGMLCFVATLTEKGVSGIRVSRHYQNRRGELPLLRWLIEKLLLGKEWPFPRDTVAAVGLPRFEGALVGLAVGDALGTTLEFQEPGTFHPIRDLVGGGPFGLKPGEWTDDTSMALCLAESLIEQKGFVPVDQLERYIRWYRTGHLSSNGRCFDIGNTVRSALVRFEDTRQPYCGSEDPRSAGNGSIMRLAPVPMAFFDRPRRALELCGESSKTTHGAREAVDACRYLGALLVGALRGAAREELLEPRYTPVPGYWEQHPLAPAIDEIALGSFKTRRPPEIRGSGYVVRSLEAALWAFYHTRSFRDGCLLAVNLGDDADTTGAVYGQLAGAFYGAGGIPERWKSRLAQRSLIESTAERLMQLPRVMGLEPGPQ